MTQYVLSFGSIQTSKVLWSLKLDSPELASGMYAAINGIIDDLNDEYYVTTDLDLSRYRYLNNVSEEDVHKPISRLLDNEYGIWMKSDTRFQYDLYVFKTGDFFQGVISACHAFFVDFRNYIYAYPFDTYNNQYILNGYLMTPYLVAQDVPDLDDMDDEEKDNENLLEPFARTDDIITIKDDEMY